MRVGIVVAVLHEVHEHLFDTELHLESVLLREPVPVGETVDRLRDPFQLPAVVAEGQTKKASVRGRFAAVDITGPAVPVLDFVWRRAGRFVTADKRVQCRNIDYASHRVPCALGVANSDRRP